jgi:hypothetical protein
VCVANGTLHDDLVQLFVDLLKIGSYLIVGVVEEEDSCRKYDYVRSAIQRTRGVQAEGARRAYARVGMPALLDEHTQVRQNIFWNAWSFVFLANGVHELGHRTLLKVGSK